MSQRNPKLAGTGVVDCVPQDYPCPNRCNECFFLRNYEQMKGPRFPGLEEVQDKIVRVNSGHDSNVDQEFVIRSTDRYPHRFFNTSIPRWDFPAPVVYTVNPQEEEPVPPGRLALADNLMFARLRVSSSNLHLLPPVIRWYRGRNIPICLTFMRYAEVPPHCPDFILEKVGGPAYTRRVHVVNSYWCPTRAFVWAAYRLLERTTGRPRVFICQERCVDCRQCEHHFWRVWRRFR